MEVHNHSHTERKKFTHYLWEFLMLFLAVFAGFLAENQREHIVEHQRAEQFARSLLADLKADTAALKIAIGYGDKKVKAIDSFFSEIELTPAKWNDTLMYKYGGAAGRIRPFERNSGTYEQMKASGSLRYFQQELADLLNKYDVQAKKVVARRILVRNTSWNFITRCRYRSWTAGMLSRYRMELHRRIPWFSGKRIRKRSLSGSIMRPLFKVLRKEH